MPPFGDLTYRITLIITSQVTTLMDDEYKTNYQSQSSASILINNYSRFFMKTCKL